MTQGTSGRLADSWAPITRLCHEQEPARGTVAARGLSSDRACLGGGHRLNGGQGSVDSVPRAPERGGDGRNRDLGTGHVPCRLLLFQGQLWPASAFPTTGTGRRDAGTGSV